jgi:hypothetical protein
LGDIGRKRTRRLDKAAVAEQTFIENGWKASAELESPMHL